MIENAGDKAPIDLRSTIPTPLLIPLATYPICPANFLSKSNGFVERLHRTLFDEHFRTRGARPGTSRSNRCRKTSTPTCITTTTSEHTRAAT